jgi:hypothetical protein
MSGGLAGLAVAVFVAVVVIVFVISMFVPERSEEPGNRGDAILVLIVTFTPLAILFSGGCAVISMALWIAGPIETW